jgi:4-alpha-glucanotransferase
VQYTFYKQWQALKAYANQKGISIMGDVPIYVPYDSVEIWKDPELFWLDESLQPTQVAGCPPDAFSEDGQLWGNPLYRWKEMEKDGFRWYLERLEQAANCYDLVRLDHFRGFVGYWSVPYGDATARNGKWDSAPGIALFRTLRKTYPKAKIIAEDLGFITEDVRELLDDAGFPGMKMLHFAFYDEDSENLPRMYPSKNCVVYSASHDSDCTYTWQKNLQGEARRRFNQECKRNPSQHRTYDLIEFAMRSCANLAMVPLQDYLNLSNEEGRMNIPATADGNWAWRVSSRYNTPQLRAKILSLVTRTKRNK